MGCTNQVTKNCIVCQKVCTREESTMVHACCDACRGLYYSQNRDRKIIDTAIKNNTLETLGMKISKIIALGYSVSIVKIPQLRKEIQIET
jgi:hypothetical protein